MKFVAVVLAVTVASPTLVLAATDLSAKAKRSYEQCYKSCTETGGKPRSCAVQCQSKS